MALMAGVRLSCSSEIIASVRFTAHHLMQQGTYIFLQSNQIGSRPRRTAIVTACVRSFAPSLPTTFLM